MPQKVFTAPNAWLGGFYDTAFFFPKSTPLLPILEHLWSFPHLAGPFSSRDVEPEEQTLTRVASDAPSYGVLTLEDGKRVACKTHAFDEGDEVQVELSIVLGSLVLAWPVVGAFPFVSHAQAESWEPRLEATLVDLAHHVYMRAPFLRGLAGFENIGFSDDLRRPGPVPATRGVGIFDVIDGAVRWWPPTLRGGSPIEDQTTFTRAD